MNLLHKLSLLLLLSHVVVPSQLSIRYEAENAHFLGGAQLMQNISGYSAWGFVELYPYQLGAIIFTINILEDGLYPISFSYCSAQDWDSIISIHTNGMKQTTVILPAFIVGWSIQKEGVYLRQGLNTLSIRGTNLPTTISIDFIEVWGAIPLAARGATQPYYEIEAEDAIYTGTRIGPSRDLYRLSTEASGRYAVQITSGQYVEFTLPAPANALVLRYSIPDSPSGTGQIASLNVLVNGGSALNLTVTSVYSWNYGAGTKNPADGNPRHFYDDTRAMFGKTLPAGAKVRFQGLNSIIYTIDVADFYTVPDPYSMPSSGFLSVTDFGADPSGTKDSTVAFNKTITQAMSQNRGIWLPQGVFLVNGIMTVNSTTVRGAGPWFSIVKSTGANGPGFMSCDDGSLDVQFLDFAMIGESKIGNDSVDGDAVGGVFDGNSLMQNLWIEHSQNGLNLGGGASGLHILGVTIRNNFGAGISFGGSISDSIVEQNVMRNTGGDAIFALSSHYANVNNTFQFNTVQVPCYGSGIAVYGGTNTTINDNIIADCVGDAGGIEIAQSYGEAPLDGLTLVERVTLNRCGAPASLGIDTYGAIYLLQLSGQFQGNVTIQDIECFNFSFAGAVTFFGVVGYFENIVLSRMNVTNGPYVLEAENRMLTKGDVECDHIIASGITSGSIYSCSSGMVFHDLGGNVGWNLDPAHQLCNQSSVA